MVLANLLETDMNRAILAAALTLMAGAALAEPSCEATAVASEAVKFPVWQAVQAFENEGGKIIAFKINDGGCYEVCGTLGEQKFEVFHDPATGVEIERIED